MPEAISIERLSKFYGSLTAIDEVDFKVTKGSCTGYLGPNGSGKTTTIRIMTGLAKPSRGKAYLFGHDVDKDLKHALFDTGAIVETPSFPRYLSPEEVLTFISDLRGINEDQVPSLIKSALESVGLSEWKDKAIGEFSKGMNQRLALACALFHDPELLILDEPTSGLDPMGMADIRGILKSLKKKGKTIFLSTHLVSEVKELCDSVIMLDKGSVVYSDSVENISKRYAGSSMKVKLLRRASEEQLASIKRIRSVSKIETEGETGLILDYQGSLEDRVHILKSMVGMDLEITSFEEQGNMIESLYLQQISGSVK